MASVVRRSSSAFVFFVCWGIPGWAATDGACHATCDISCHRARIETNSAASFAPLTCYMSHQLWDSGKNYGSRYDIFCVRYVVCLFCLRDVQQSVIVCSLQDVASLAPEKIFTVPCPPAQQITGRHNQHTLLSINSTFIFNLPSYHIRKPLFFLAENEDRIWHVENGPFSTRHFELLKKRPKGCVGS